MSTARCIACNDMTGNNHVDSSRCCASGMLRYPIYHISPYEIRNRTQQGEQRAYRSELDLEIELQLGSHVRVDPVMLNKSEHMA